MHELSARVIAQHRGAYTVATADGERLVTLAGALRHAAAGSEDLPAVGDHVLLHEGTIRALLPRRNAVRRRDEWTHSAQVLAANVDDVLVVAPLHRDLGPIAARIQQYVALARDADASPTILLTKADLCPDVRAQVTRAERAASGVAVHVTSSVTGEGVDALGERLAARTAVLLGPSGAGKSTIVNRLLGRDLLRTLEIDALGEGRHATARRQLVALPRGGWVIDTPGLREVDGWIGRDTVGAAFADVVALAARCRFRDCAHAGEPGCAVGGAIADGTLDGSRLRAMRALEREVARTERTEAERLAARREDVAGHRRRVRARRSGRGR